MPRPPPQQFAYRKAGDVAAGEAVGRGRAWHGRRQRRAGRSTPKSGSYLRFQGGKAHNDAARGQVNADNVVVLVVDYQPSQVDAKSPEAQTIGTGEAFVFSGGKVRPRHVDPRRSAVSRSC